MKQGSHADLQSCHFISYCIPVERINAGNYEQIEIFFPAAYAPFAQFQEQSDY